jgi:site-specific recombinase
LNEFRDLILSLFPPEVRGNASLRALAARMQSFVQAENLHAKLDAFVELMAWARVPDAQIVDPLRIEPAPQDASSADWKRERVFLSILETSTEIQRAYIQSVEAILQQTEGVALFAQSGLPTDRGFVAELLNRILRNLLPAPREDSDLARLFLRLFPTRKQANRFFSLPPDVIEKISALSVPPAESAAWRGPVESLLDAVCLLGARVQGLGLSEELRIRSVYVHTQDSPFYRLTRAIDVLVTALKHHEDFAEAAQTWKAAVMECREELKSITSHLDARGVNLDVVYALDVIEKSLARMELISGILFAQSGPPKLLTGQRLMRDVIRGRQDDRSLRSLFHNTFRLLARKIVDWAGNTGEHYITSDRKEYGLMWRAAMGGGLLTVGTAAIKMLVTHAGLPPFVEGVLAGLNYAISFVLMQNWHLVLATKQPSMTGATLAKIIHRCQDESSSKEIAEFAARIMRSQLAAALGNILAVGAGAVVFSLIWKLIAGSSFLPQDSAVYAVHSMHPVQTGTIFYAALTGVILWLSSLAGGWIENWAVYYQLPRAVAEHRLGASLNPETLARITASISHNLAGWGGSIVLGFMLGMTPVMGKFFGLPLDVRHVTLSTGTVALGMASEGLAAIGLAPALWAAAGIAITFFLNLSVSFYLALRLALSAQDVSRNDHLEIVKTLSRQFLASPKQFFLPPAKQALREVGEQP